MASPGECLRWPIWESTDDPSHRTMRAAKTEPSCVRVRSFAFHPLTRLVACSRFRQARVMAKAASKGGHTYPLLGSTASSGERRLEAPATTATPAAVQQ
ncbi:FAD dependent oxidoreductase [Anopheles sinensis]|uniref:FAD dependent oxidoreductase n=1 Tax=Anopheles sinensis TaxID=74873 RepID=A0A084WJ76_ANOSI|nr:FAD dependent oxidoreductase [Anopheles sinensis]